MRAKQGKSDVLHRTSEGPFARQNPEAKETGSRTRGRVHELVASRGELKMQNDGLRRAQEEITAYESCYVNLRVWADRPLWLHQHGPYHRGKTLLVLPCSVSKEGCCMGKHSSCLWQRNRGTHIIGIVRLSQQLVSETPVSCT